MSENKLIAKKELELAWLSKLKILSNYFIV